MDALILIERIKKIMNDSKNTKAQAFVGVVNYVMKKDAEVLKAEGVMEISTKIL